ncbi:MAG: 50S ribosomal protein L29 [Calditrichaeota bacterium]|nr:50S ribosomal protein L29 [Candidatus Cloacimonadota bacterium]MCB1045721.1 50S ribosomal protein L29 [Calditrichota bacterium]MCB9472283.1 50S ribosomal protein L29 [Candidatus Delongbacteria bacterium]
MKAKELNTLGRAELLTRLSEAEAAMSSLNFKHGTSQLDNPLEIRRVRKNIARLQTLVREMDLGIRKES